MAVTRKWSAPTPAVRISLLVLAGVLLAGGALWAGSVGPWVGRPRGASSPQDLPKVTDFPTPPTLPTFAPPQARPAGSSWDPSVLLYVLTLILLLALLSAIAFWIRNRGVAAGTSRPAKSAAPDEVERLVVPPDQDRPFDPREAADYVIACWGQLEQGAAARGRGRRREQTPTEFIEELQATYPIDAAASTELLGLYQRARFDHARLLPDTATRARISADVLLAGLAATGVTP